MQNAECGMDEEPSPLTLYQLRIHELNPHSALRTPHSSQPGFDALKLATGIDAACSAAAEVRPNFAHQGAEFILGTRRDGQPCTEFGQAFRDPPADPSGCAGDEDRPPLQLPPHRPHPFIDPPEPGQQRQEFSL